MHERSLLAKGVREVFATPGPSRHWFGYYDKSPFDVLGDRMLSHKADFDGRLPEAGDEAEVGFFTLADSTFTSLGVTRAFNWQQGAMLQWLGPDFSRKVLYNDLRKGEFVSVVVDVQTGSERVLPQAVYTVEPNGRFALCVNFQRHYWCRRGYSYAGIENPRWKGNMPVGDGISLLDIETGETQQILTTRQLYENHHLTSMQNAPNYLEHLLFSPNGERFFFYHRWETADGGIYGRVYTANRDGSELRLLADSGSLSHYCWRGNGELLVFGSLPTAVTRLRRSGLAVRMISPFIGLYRRLARRFGGIRRCMVREGYLLIDEGVGAIRMIAPCSLTEDGHPSFRPGDPDWFVTDTYEDAEYYRSLLLFNVAQERLATVARLWSPPEANLTSWRCDLHPRWDRQGTRLCVDSFCSGSRQMDVFDITELLAQSVA